RRIFGPCRSAKIATGWSRSDDAWRTVLNVVVWTSWSPWLKFIRATLTPALMSSLVVLYPCVAGPNVATIFACLIYASLRFNHLKVNHWMPVTRMTYIMGWDGWDRRRP